MVIGKLLAPFEKNSDKTTAITKFWSSIGRTDNHMFPLDKNKILSVEMFSDPISSSDHELHELTASLRACGVDIDSLSRKKPLSCPGPVPPQPRIPTYASVTRGHMPSQFVPQLRQAHTVSQTKCNNGPGCSYLARGRCLFQHSQSERTPPPFNRSYDAHSVDYNEIPYCIQHNYKGGCTYGANCNYWHEKEPVAIQAARRRAKAQIRRL